MLISTNGNNLLTSNYFKDFIESENSNNTNTHLKSSRIQGINFNINPNTKMSSNVTGLKSKNTDNKHYNQLKFNNSNKNIDAPINANNYINNNNFSSSLRGFDSSKTFSTRNINGKKFVFNENNNSNTNINTNNPNVHHQHLKYQASTKNVISPNFIQNTSSVITSTNSLVEKPNNLNRFSKLGKDNPNTLAQKSTDKLRNLFANKFA